MFKTGFAGNLSDSIFKIVTKHPGFKLTGVLDTGNTNIVIPDNIPLFSADILLDNNDVLIIQQTGPGMPELLAEALRRSKPVMLMDIAGLYSAPVNRLLKLQEEAQGIIKVIYPERTNPALNACISWLTHPFFIEVKLMTPQNKSGDEDSLATGALLRMLDALCSLCNCNFRKIDTLRFPLNISSSGLISGRIEFDNGSVASILTSKMTDNETFTIDIYQIKNALKVDMINHKLEYTEKNPEKNNINSTIKNYAFNAAQSLYNELDGFHYSIINKNISGRELFEVSRLMDLCRKIIDHPGIRGVIKNK